MSALYKDWFTHRAYYTIFPDVCEDDDPEAPEEDPSLFSGEIGRIDGFRFFQPWPEGSFAVEADIPERPKQIVHGPQRKGRGGKIKRW